jgi:hypothetical protein
MSEIDDRPEDELEDSEEMPTEEETTAQGTEAPTLAETAKSEDVVTVREAIYGKYGFIPSDEYVRDFIEFVKEMSRNR